MARWWYTIAESHSERRRNCSPCKNALSAGSDAEPSGVLRTSPRNTRTASESATRSMRDARSRSSISPSPLPVFTSSTVAVRRTESSPAPTRLPNTTVPAPVSRPKARADAGSARPRQRRTTSVGDTVRSGPAPSRLRDNTSTSPSCHSVRLGWSTSNGATATRLASRADAGRARNSHQAATSTTALAAASRRVRCRPNARTATVRTVPPLGVTIASSALNVSSWSSPSSEPSIV